MVNATYDDIFSAALELAPGLKAMLAEQLLHSLDGIGQAEIDAAWAEEVERRIEAVDRGEVELMDGERVLKELRDRMVK